MVLPVITYARRDRSNRSSTTSTDDVDAAPISTTMRKRARSSTLKSALTTDPHKKFKKSALPVPNSPTDVYSAFQTPHPSQLTESQIFKLQSSRPVPEQQFSPVPLAKTYSPLADSQIISATRNGRTSSRNLKENLNFKDHEHEYQQPLPTGTPGSASSGSRSRSASRTRRSKHTRKSRSRKTLNTVSSHITSSRTLHTLYSSSSTKKASRSQTLASPFTSRPQSPSDIDPPHISQTMGPPPLPVPTKKKRTLSDTHFNPNLPSPGAPILSKQRQRQHQLHPSALPLPSPIPHPRGRGRFYSQSTHTSPNQPGFSFSPFPPQKSRDRNANLASDRRPSAASNQPPPVFDTLFKPYSGLGVVNFNRPPSQLSLYANAFGEDSDEAEETNDIGVDAEVGPVKRRRRSLGWTWDAPCNELFGTDVWGVSTPAHKLKRMLSLPGDLGSGRNDSHDENMEVQLEVEVRSSPAVDPGLHVSYDEMGETTNTKMNSKILTASSTSIPIPIPKKSRTLPEVAITGTMQSHSLPLPETTRDSSWVTDSLISPPTVYLKAREAKEKLLKLDQRHNHEAGRLELGPAFVSGGRETFGASPDSNDSNSNLAGQRRGNDKSKDKLEFLFDSLDLDLESEDATTSSQKDQEDIEPDPTPALPPFNRSRSGTIRGPTVHSSFTRTRSGTVLDSGAPSARTRSGTILGPRPSAPPTRTRSGTILGPAAAPTRTRSGTILAAPPPPHRRSRARSGSILAGPDLPIAAETHPEDENEDRQGREISLTFNPENDGNPIAEEPVLDGADVEMEMGYADASFSPPRSSSPDPIDFLSCRSGGSSGSEMWTVAEDPPSPLVTRKKMIKIGSRKKQVSYVVVGGCGKLGTARVGKGKRGRGRTRIVGFESALDEPGEAQEDEEGDDVVHVDTDPLNLV